MLALTIASMTTCVRSTFYNIKFITTQLPFEFQVVSVSDVHQFVDGIYTTNQYLLPLDTQSTIKLKCLSSDVEQTILIQPSIAVGASNQIVLCQVASTNVNINLQISAISTIAINGFVSQPDGTLYKQGTTDPLIGVTIKPGTLCIVKQSLVTTKSCTEGPNDLSLTISPFSVSGTVSLQDDEYIFVEYGTPAPPTDEWYHTSEIFAFPDFLFTFNGIDQVPSFDLTQYNGVCPFALMGRVQKGVQWRCTSTICMEIQLLNQFLQPDYAALTTAVQKPIVLGLLSKNTDPNYIELAFFMSVENDYSFKRANILPLSLDFGLQIADAALVLNIVAGVELFTDSSVIQTTQGAFLSFHADMFSIAYRSISSTLCNDNTKITVIEDASGYPTFYPESASFGQYIDGVYC